MDEESRRDIVEAMEALERAKDRWIKSPGSAHVHMCHALLVLKLILERNSREDR